MWLSAAGYEVSVARDGLEAVTVLSQRPYNLMLTDIIMPDRDGIETLMEVRRLWPRCKVVAMSGGGRVGAELFLSLAGELGADSTIRKPFKREAILDLIAGTLEPA